MSAQDFSQLEFQSEAIADRSGVTSFRPWPRYFARMLDMVVLSMPIMFGMVIVGMVVAPAGTERFVDLVSTGLSSRLLGGPIAALLGILPIGLLVAFGQTPGKWLFGIRVRQADGRRLDWRTALRREAMVVIHGLALAIPLLNCITLYRSMARLNDTGSTAWDERLGCTVSHGPANAWWWAKAWFGGLAWAGITFYERIVSALA